MSANKSEHLNLHLWVPQDDFLRTEFNENFTALDAALGSASDRLDNLSGGLIREFYRQAVRQRVETGSAIISELMWINALASEEDTTCTIAKSAWNGRYGLSMGHQTPPTLEGIRATAQKISAISTVPTYTEQGRTAAMTFTSDGDGTMTSVLVWSWMNDHYTSYEFTYTLKLTRLDTNEVVGTAGPYSSASHPSVYYGMPRDVKFPLEKGVSYRLEYSCPEDATFYGKASFSLVDKATTSQFDDLEFLVPPIYHSHIDTVAPPTWARSASAVMHWNGDADLTLSVNDKALTASGTRDSVNADGIACRETEFSLNPLPDGDLTVRMTMWKGDGPSHLYDYGFIWK